MMPLSYATSLAYLYSLQKHGIKLGLETILRLLSDLGDPQERFATLHIAGTNGKGSAAAMAAAILKAAGMRVGLYTSPHLIDYRERMRVQGECIAENRVVDLLARVRAVSSFAAPPTFFETTTAMAFQYFAEEGVDVAVVEVGMGGRFDATNTCRPVGTLITNISFDHEMYLGYSLEEIAFEKAGIVKEGGPVVLGPMEEKANLVLTRRASDMGASVSQYGKEFTVESAGSRVFDYIACNSRYPRLHCQLAGAHQTINAGCAIALLEQSFPRKIPESAIRQGLETVVWEGRLETLMTDPLVVCDGAHNPAAAEALADFLHQKVAEQPDRHLILIVGMMRDKNVQGFLRKLSSLAKVLIFTQIAHPRSAIADELQQTLTEERALSYSRSEPSDALSLALRLAKSQDIICITGSLFLVGYVKSLLAGCEYAPVVG